MDNLSSKKIAFVLGGLNYGGAERVASKMIRYWNDEARPLSVISRRGPEHDFFKIPENIERYNLGGEGASANKIVALFKNIPHILKLRKAIKQSEADVVISFLTKTNIQTILASIGLRVRIVISERNDTTRQHYPWPWPYLRKKVYRFADVVTANSQVAIDGMKSYVSKKKLHLVRNPLQFPEYFAKPDCSTILLNVGRLVPQKAQYLLLEAFSKIEMSIIKDWKCVILGEGDERVNLRKQSSRLNIHDKLELAGLVENPSQYYTSAAIFVLTSEYEGTPNALLEAMAHGLPVVVSDSLPGAMEYVQDGKNGLIFEALNSDDLSEKLEYLINNPNLRKKMGDKSIDLVKDLSIDIVMQNWHQLLDEAK